MSKFAFNNLVISTIKCTLRFVTYNLLADLYADSDHSRTVLHPQCPPYALEIDYRKQVLLPQLVILWMPSCSTMF